MPQLSERTFLYRFLPDEIRAFFLASGFEDVEAIAATYGLSQDAIDILDVIQQEVLFGYEPVDKVRNLIQDRLKFDEKLATRVTLDLIEKRFLPIDSYLGSTAFRVFASLGGNVTVVNIKRIDASGGTVVDVRRSMTEYLAEQAVKAANPPAPVVEPIAPSPVVQIPDPVVAPKPVVEQPVVPAPVVHVAPLPVVDSVPAPVKEPAITPKPVVAPIVKPPVDLAPLPKPIVAPVVSEEVKTVEAFDKKLDRVDPVRKGEQGKETGVVNAPLDPSHELAPPPPALVTVSDQPKTRKIASFFSRKPKTTVKSEPIVPQKSEPVSSAPVKATESIMRAPTREIVAKVTSVKRSNAFPEVEEEAEVAKMMKSLGKGSQVPQSLENSKINEVQRKLSLSFPSAELDKRFRVLVGSRLSGVRTGSAFASALARPIVQGGLGFDTHTVERVLDTVEGHLQTSQTSATTKLAEEKAAYIATRTEQYKTDVQTPPTQEKAPLATPPTPAAPKTRAVLSQSTVKAVRTSSGKQPVVDVQYKRRLVGPVEELKRMNLEDFRRLPGDAAEVLENIREDIQAMSQRDPALSIQGVEAWRSSPLVGLYRKLMSTALQKGVAIESILSDKQLNPGAITLEELNAIRAFNASLRY